MRRSHSESSFGRNSRTTHSGSRTTPTVTRLRHSSLQTTCHVLGGRSAVSLMPICCSGLQIGERLVTTKSGGLTTNSRTRWFTKMFPRLCARGTSQSSPRSGWLTHSRETTGSLKESRLGCVERLCQTRSGERLHRSINETAPPQAQDDVHGGRCHVADAGRPDSLQEPWSQSPQRSCVRNFATLKRFNGLARS